jgi:cysteine desulfurase
MARIYFDYAASTPLDPRVLAVMKPYFLEEFGNPGALHSYGQKAIAAVDASREVIAGLIGAKFREIVFAGSATEANNLALRGAFHAYKKSEQFREGKRPRIIISTIEHESVLETARALEREGAEVVFAPVTNEGLIDLDKIKYLLSENTAIVSIMYVNNEIGVVQPIVEIAKIIADFKVQNHLEQYPLFHTDAAQAVQFFNCDGRTRGLDMMTLSAHKIYGPKGIGALFIKHDSKGFWPITPETTGGGQEFGLRSGTENVPSIVGFAMAMELAVATREEETKRIAELREALWEDIKKIVPQAQLNSPGFAAEKSSPHILNCYFPEHEAQDLLIQFDRAGIAVSTGSACRSRATEPSYVIEALGYSSARAKASIRFSFGRTTTKSDITRATKLFAKIFRNSK